MSLWLHLGLTSAVVLLRLVMLLVGMQVLTALVQPTLLWRGLGQRLTRARSQ
jgi:hypothetical protein